MPAIKTGVPGHDTALFAAEVAHQLATPAGRALRHFGPRIWRF